jgi:DNA-binding response OmpR family regulator
MKKVLLVFDDAKELDFIDANLNENGFTVIKTETLESALAEAKKNTPDLIVINTINIQNDIDFFEDQLKVVESECSLLVCLNELEDHLNASSQKYLVAKPVRPKVLLSLIRGIMNNEEVNWLIEA